jgi:2-polyprenyl-6-methoxyphenol hydroxylase-like FAD-dependent oxidoreductase
MAVDVAIAGGGPAGLAAAVALQRADPSMSIHVFERTNMNARGAAVMVGVNGLLALNAIDPQLPKSLLSKAIRLEGSGEMQALLLRGLKGDERKRQQICLQNAAVAGTQVRMPPWYSTISGHRCIYMLPFMPRASL